MKASELLKELENVDPNSEVILVVYTRKGYQAGYVDRIDPNCRFNSVTKQKLDEDESVVEITTSTKVK